MARARNIKPGFFLNDELAELEALARLLFIGLWCIADREGRLEDKPKRIKAEALPYDDCDIEKLLNNLQNAGFILRYAVNGNRYIQIINFKKHQNPHVKEAPSTIPSPESDNPEPEPTPEKHHTSTIQEQETHTTNPADSLMLIPSCGFPHVDAGLPESGASTKIENSGSDTTEICKAYQENGFGPMSSITFQKLQDLVEHYTFVWVKEALGVAVIRGKRNLGYVEGILKRAMNEGCVNLDNPKVNSADKPKGELKVLEIPTPEKTEISDSVLKQFTDKVINACKGRMPNKEERAG